jgi:hypothetical protein
MTPINNPTDTVVGAGVTAKLPPTNDNVAFEIALANENVSLVVAVADAIGTNATEQVTDLKLLSQRVARGDTQHAYPLLSHTQLVAPLAHITEHIDVLAPVHRYGPGPGWFKTTRDL